MTRDVRARPERVLQVVGRMDRAGAETMIMNLYREIDRARFQFDFVYFTTDRCDYDDEIEALGGRIHRLVSRNPLIRLIRFVALLKSGPWSIVHSHTLFSSAFYLLAALAAGVPQRIAHSHSTQDVNSSRFLGRVYQDTARRLLSCAANSRVACGAAAAEYLFGTRYPVTLIPNAINLGSFSNRTASSVRKEFGITEQGLLVVHVAQFMPVKNHAWSIEVADELRTQHLECKVLLVGEGPTRRQIEEQLISSQLQDYVVLAGLRTDVPEIMAAADVMLMPSFYEGFPLVLVEAQAAGLHSVVSASVAREVDLGLGLVHFVDLSAPRAAWVEIILASSQLPVPSAEIRAEVLKRAGYTASQAAGRLADLYGQP